MYYTHAHIIYVIFSRICSTCCKGPSDDALPGVEAPATSYSTCPQLTPLLPLFVGCEAFLKVLFVFSMNYLIYIVGAILLVDSGAPNLWISMYFAKSAKILIRTFARINRVCHRIHKELKHEDIAGQRLKYIKDLFGELLF